MAVRKPCPFSRIATSIAWRSGSARSSTTRMEGAAIPPEGSFDHLSPGVWEKLGTEATCWTIKQNLGLREFEQTHCPVSSAVSAGLTAAEGCRRVGRWDNCIVDRDHSCLKPPCNPLGGASVLSPDARTQGKTAGVRRRDRLVGILHTSNHDQRAEGPCQDRLRVGGLCKQDRRRIEPAGA